MPSPTAWGPPGAAGTRQGASRFRRSRRRRRRHPTRTIAEVIGRQLDVPVISVGPADTADHFGWIGNFFSLDMPASSTITQKMLGWTPTHPTLLEDLEAGHYFR